MIANDRITKRLKVCGLMLLALLGSVLAVSAQQEGEEKESGNRFRVTLFNDWKGPELFIMKKKAYQVLTVHKMAYTEAFRYPSGKPIVLFSKNPNPEGEEEYLPYLQVSVPTQISEPMLVIFWDEKNKKANGMCVEFSERGFPFGSYQLVNLSRAKLIGYIGDKKKRFSCNPMSTYITPRGFKNGERTPIVASTQVESKLSLVFSTLTIHRERKRVILFLNAERNKLNKIVYSSQSLVDFNNPEE